MLIGLSGAPNSGKDTVGAMLVDCGYVQMAFAEPLRKMAYAIDPLVGWVEDGPIRYAELIDAIGYRRAKDEFPEVRRFLQRLGTEGVRAIDNDFWIKALISQISPDGVTEVDVDVVVTDVRFVREADVIREYGGKVVLIERPGYEVTDSHIAEHALKDYDFDAKIVNDGTFDALRIKVKDLLL